MLFLVLAISFVSVRMTFTKMREKNHYFDFYYPCDSDWAKKQRSEGKNPKCVDVERLLGPDENPCPSGFDLLSSPNSDSCEGDDKYVELLYNDDGTITWYGGVHSWYVGEERKVRESYAQACFRCAGCSQEDAFLAEQNYVENYDGGKGWKCPNGEIPTLAGDDIYNVGNEDRKCYICKDTCKYKAAWNGDTRKWSMTDELMPQDGIFVGSIYNKNDVCTPERPVLEKYNGLGRMKLQSSYQYYMTFPPGRSRRQCQRCINPCEPYDGFKPEPYKYFWAHDWKERLDEGLIKITLFNEGKKDSNGEQLYRNKEEAFPEFYMYKNGVSVKARCSKFMKMEEFVTEDCPKDYKLYILDQDDGSIECWDDFIKPQTTGVVFEWTDETKKAVQLDWGYDFATYKFQCAKCDNPCEDLGDYGFPNIPWKIEGAAGRGYTCPLREATSSGYGTQPAKNSHTIMGKKWSPTASSVVGCFKCVPPVCPDNHYPQWWYTACKPGMAKIAVGNLKGEEYWMDNGLKYRCAICKPTYCVDYRDNTGYGLPKECLEYNPDNEEPRGLHEVAPEYCRDRMIYDWFKEDVGCAITQEEYDDEVYDKAVNEGEKTVCETENDETAFVCDCTDKVKLCEGEVAELEKEILDMDDECDGRIIDAKDVEAQKCDERIDEEIIEKENEMTKLIEAEKQVCMTKMDALEDECNEDIEDAESACMAKCPAAEVVDGNICESYIEASDFTWNMPNRYQNHYGTKNGKMDEPYGLCIYSYRTKDAEMVFSSPRVVKGIVLAGHAAWGHYCRSGFIEVKKGGSFMRLEDKVSISNKMKHEVVFQDGPIDNVDSVRFTCELYSGYSCWRMGYLKCQ